MLSIKTISAPMGDKKKLLIDALNLQPGNMIGILGPNGAGKSTLIQLIAQEKKYDGVVSLHGKDLRHWSDKARAKQIAVLSQQQALNFPFTAQEVVALGLIPLGLSNRKARHLINENMQKTHCDYLANQLYTTLSGGEKQRVHLARVLLQLSHAKSPPLLLLDEPTSAQDLGQQHQILQLILSLCKNDGYLAVVVLHDINHALRYCDESCILNNGDMIDFGETQSVLNEENIKRCWGYQANFLQNSDGEKLLV